ncbi:mediator of RNA polymerase II transcription subunit 30 [Aplysia californica]|uniref:Mediator of RNA polymerase II transcription subunit 30 n=1 Tax=Aplysia californica TaxID=6500 RepID=A0ABM0K039_APLCA|nr:mediator of RNA polymerase II transcription subunit 30 [Aplysia californica]XP_035827542.1 mediator of RNA polymerase II transcription subunit 30 [Aplysia californica]
MATPGPGSAGQAQSQQHPYSSQRGEASGPGSFPPMMQQSPAPAPQMMSPTKDINVVNMCRVGQEIVHDIVGRAQELFQSLGPKHMQLPNNVTFHGQQYAERKAKVDEQLRQINMNFRKLRLFFSKVNETVEQTELPSEQELVPYVGKEVDTSEKEYSDVYHYTVEQHRDMLEQVKLKNRQLKEIIDIVRSIIWEINTMITMRKG